MIDEDDLELSKSRTSWMRSKIQMLESNQATNIKFNEDKNVEIFSELVALKNKINKLESKCKQMVELYNHQVIRMDILENNQLLKTKEHDKLFKIANNDLINRKEVYNLINFLAENTGFRQIDYVTGYQTGLADVKQKIGDL